MKRSYILLLMALWLGSCFAAAQGPRPRYFIRVTEPDQEALLGPLSNFQGQTYRFVRSLFNVEEQLNAAIILIDPGEVDALRQHFLTTANRVIEIIKDEECIPDQGPAPVVTDPPTVGGEDGPGRPTRPEVPREPETPREPELPSRPTMPVYFSPLDALAPASGTFTPPPASGGMVRVGVFGTGIDTDHPELNAVTFTTGISVVQDSLTNQFLNPDIDYHDHETRLTTCLAGAQHGLLPKLGVTGGYQVQSILCYPGPQPGQGPQAWSSDCIDAWSRFLIQHETRKDQPYLKNHGAVALFAHSVSAPNVRVGDLERIIDDAWEAGVVTVLSAGNKAIDASVASPAGTGEWVFFDQMGNVVSQQYWPPSGQTSYGLPGTKGFGIAPGSNPKDGQHLTVGAHNLGANTNLWTAGAGIGSNFNSTNPMGFGDPASSGVDLFAPGATIRAGGSGLNLSAGGPVEVEGMAYEQARATQVTGSGTSYAAAFVAAQATYVLAHRPWASPEQVRTTLMTASQATPDPTQTPDFTRSQVPGVPDLPELSLTFADWIERYRKVALVNYFGSGKDGVNADPDGDGVTNYWEYVCGMDPRFADAEMGPELIFDEAAHEVVVKMQQASYLPAGGPSWVFEASADLGQTSWSNEGQGTVLNQGLRMPVSGDGEMIEARLAVPSVLTKQFYRLAAGSPEGGDDDE